MITGGKLVALVDPTTNEYQIDWERSGLISGLTPAIFTFADEAGTYDLSGKVEPLRRVNPRLSRDLETIVMKAMEAEPERRYASAGERAEARGRGGSDEVTSVHDRANRVDAGMTRRGSPAQQAGGAQPDPGGVHGLGGQSAPQARQHGRDNAR